MGLDVEGDVWVFLSWSHPLRIISPKFDKSSPASRIIQIECDWSLSAALSESGDVYLWWPLGEKFWDVYFEQTEAALWRAYATENGVIPCTPQYCPYDPDILPPLPSLPLLNPSSAGSAGDDTPPKIVQIAGTYESLLCLTDKGHVLEYGVLSDGVALGHGQWRYVRLPVTLMIRYTFIHLLEAQELQRRRYHQGGLFAERNLAINKSSGYSCTLYLQRTSWLDDIDHSRRSWPISNVLWRTPQAMSRSHSSESLCHLLSSILILFQGLKSWY